MKKIIFLSIICIISLIINKHAIAENNFKKVPDTTNPKQLGIPIETTYTKQEL